MTVYLLHFAQPIGNLANPRGQAQHYIGSTDDLTARLAAHSHGNGAAIMAAVAAQGITWTLTRTWPGGRAEERRLKARHKARTLCPICNNARADLTSI